MSDIRRAIRGPMPIDQKPVLDHSKPGAPEQPAGTELDPRQSMASGESLEPPKAATQPSVIMIAPPPRQEPPPPPRRSPVPANPPRNRYGDPGMVTAELYFEWWSRINKTAMQAANCGLRSFEWFIFIRQHLSNELPFRIAGSREGSRMPERFDAHMELLQEWAGLAMKAYADDVTPAACNRLESSENLKIADYTWARFMSRM